MDIYAYKKEYFKESHEIQNAIISAVEILYERIAMYEKQNVPFGKIFNDDRVKYDKQGDFYVFKFSRSNMQLRVLYAYLIIENNPIIVVADYVVKKENNKDYTRYFEYAKSLDPYEVYNNSQLIKR